MWMDTLAAKRAIKHIANQQGTSFEEIVREIDLAIDEAIKASDDAALERWSQIPCCGERPTAVELIAYIGRKLRDNDR